LPARIDEHGDRASVCEKAACTRLLQSLTAACGQWNSDHSRELTAEEAAEELVWRVLQNADAFARSELLTQSLRDASAPRPQLSERENGARPFAVLQKVHDGAVGMSQRPTLEQMC
jgi:hypothetical protein